MEARQTDIATCDCIISDLEIVAQVVEKRATDIKYWRVDRERSERKMRGRKTTMKKEIIVNSP